MAGYGPPNTSETYTIEGIREDLSNVIENIDPTDTPFMSGIGRLTATQTKTEWQTDNLDTAAFNVVDESNVSAFVTIPKTKRPFNFLQISEKTLSLSGTADAVEMAGRQSELGYQLARLAKSLKRDCEFTMSQNQAGAAGAAAGTPRSLASYESWISTEASGHANRGGGAGADATFDAPTDTPTTAPTDGDVRALQESMVQSVLQATWTAGGEVDLLLTGPFNKRVFSGFAGNSTRFDIGEDMRLTAAISVYISDYGHHRIIASRFSRDRSLLCIDSSKWAMSFLRPFREKPLAETGDSRQRLMNVEYTLVSHNRKASGIVADLTTS